MIKLLEYASETDLPHIQNLLTADLEQEPDKVELMKQFYAKYDISTLANRKKEYFTTLAFDTLAKINAPSERKAELITLAENLLNRIQ